MKGFRMITMVLAGICILCSVSVPADAADVDSTPSAPVQSIKDNTEIDIAEFSSQGMEVRTEEHYNGRSGLSVLTGKNGEISWDFQVGNAAAYCLKIGYFPVESKNSDIRIGIRIDGEYPFDEAKNVVLKKLYKNSTDEKSYDNRGNEILPQKVQVCRLITDYVRAFSGDSDEAFRFELSPGRHTITFVAVKDTFAVTSLSFCIPPEIQTYADYHNQALQKTGSGNQKTGFKQYIQAEDAQYTTSSMMTANNDRTSPLTEPSDAYNVLYNTFGGSNWSSAGEYAVWNFTVPQDGLYEIGIKFRQNTSRAILPYRKIFLDDQIPYDELNGVSFSYSRNWQYEKLSGNHETAQFYLTAGEHSIKIESILGKFSESFDKIDEIVYELNSCYRSIIMITGASPDTYRDYQLGVKIPDTVEKLKALAKELSDIINVLDEAKIGNSETVEISTIRDQIDDFARDPDTISGRLESFKTNIGALSDWCISAKHQSVEFDYFVVCEKDAEGERVNANFFEKAALEIKSLVASFVEDYNSIGNSYGYDDSVTVWIMSGRDQANTLKSLVDSDFMVKNTIGVDLKLVTSTSVLSALIAGKGPDVALGVANADPVNYAIRNAVVDISDMEGFEDTISQFSDSAVEPFRFNGGVYALPETQVFPMMFYRKDVLEELNLSIPRTWDEVNNCLTELANLNMEFGLSCADSASTMTAMGMFLYQNGGSYYTADFKESGLSTQTALNSFKQLTALYNSYCLPYSFNDLNRFRSGEMPLVISNYSLFNTLCVSASEINGLWGVTTVPGTVREDGTVDRSVIGTATGTIITSTAKNIDAAWKFAKWWVSAETQASYGLRLEGFLGQAARYATANLEALTNLPWSEDELAMLKEQQVSVKAIPETPGSYFTPRHLYNAFRRVITYDDDPRQTMIDYTEFINREITSKREEFGLS